MKTTPLLALGAAALTAAAVSAPSPAAACGGFFCNNQGIDQSGENILFSYNADGTVTTVVQILYQGPSEEFAWILPVPAEPTVSVGTDALFQQLGQSTTPRFQLDYQTTGTCRGEPGCYGYYDDAFEADGPSRGGGADAGVAPPSVEVTFRGNVGPYDVAVLTSADADALRTWLDDNGYLIPASAGAELDYYVERDHYYVALRLQKDRDSGEIQPIVLTSANNEPCVPIRLTRIAAVADMPITAYFLGDRRSRPLNYMLVDPDLDDVGLWTGATNYQSAVTRAVDDAGGHAFVTDYAGDVPSISLELADIEDLRTITDPAAFLNALQSRGFNGDSQLLQILLRHLPPPAEFGDAQTFYNCLVGGWCGIDLVAYVAEVGFDPSLLVDDLDEAIAAPRRAAQAMLDAHPHLTRLFTTMSPDEMTEDPMFMRSDELAREHSNVHMATHRTDCGPEYFRWTAPQTIILPSGRSVVQSEGVPYYGTDDEYCEDRYEGDFTPGTPMERLREVSRERALEPGGGGICSIQPGARDVGAVALLGLAIVGFVWRRRRSE